MQTVLWAINLFLILQKVIGIDLVCALTFTARNPLTPLSSWRARHPARSHQVVAGVAAEAAGVSIAEPHVCIVSTAGDTIL